MCVILVLCTANLCRSPMAAALMARRLKIAGIQASVESAGLLTGGVAPPAEVLVATGLHGIDLTAHRSHEVTGLDIERADLILAMARSHLRHAVVLAPAAWPRSFTFRELLRRAATASPRQPGESLATWLGRLHDGRRRADLLGDSGEDDVPDPIGGPPSAYRATAVSLDEMAIALIAAAWPASTARSSSAGVSASTPST